MGSGVVTDQNTNTAVVVIAWILAILSLGYLLPWAIAATRGKSNATAILLVNFFLGWTFIGWVAALVMACGTHQVVGGTTNIVMVQANTQFVQPQHAPVPPQYAPVPPQQSVQAVQAGWPGTNPQNFPAPTAPASGPLPAAPQPAPHLKGSLGATNTTAPQPPEWQGNGGAGQ
jgi:hypothetical protein